MAEKYNLIHERVDDIPLLIRLMQHGYSKDHRPDLPQLKLMAAAEPSGHLIASDVWSQGR